MVPHKTLIRRFSVLRGKRSPLRGTIQSSRHTGYLHGRVLAAVKTLTTLPSYQALEAYVYIRVDLPSKAKITKLSPDAQPDGWDQRPLSSAS